MLADFLPDLLADALGDCKKPEEEIALTLLPSIGSALKPAC